MSGGCHQQSHDRSLPNTAMLLRCDEKDKETVEQTTLSRVKEDLKRDPSRGETDCNTPMELFSVSRQKVRR